VVTRVYIACSVDGYIADEDDGLGWLERFDATAYGYQDFVAGVGAIILGRRTYEIVRTFGAWPYADHRTFVLATEPVPDLPPDTTWVGEGIGAALSAAKAATDREVWINGGGQVVRSALAAGLVDRLELFVLPVLLGRGIPLFENGSEATPADLTLVGHDVFADGVVRVDYQLG